MNSFRLPAFLLEMPLPALLLLTAGLTSCASTRQADYISGSPLKKIDLELKFESIGFPSGSGTSYEITSDAKLKKTWMRLDRMSASPRIQRRRLNSEAWDIFVAHLDRLQVWRWKSVYNDPDICDGTAWNLIIKGVHKDVTSRGSNAGPDPTNPTKTVFGMHSADTELERELITLWEASQ